MNIHVDNTSISTTMKMIDVDMKSVDNSDSDTTCYGSNVKKFVDTISSDTTSSASSSVDLGARKLVMEDFHFMQRLGNGDIGTAYLVELEGKRGCYFAAKVMDKEELVYRKKECRAGVEKMILQMLDHPFCPSLYATLDCPRMNQEMDHTSPTSQDTDHDSTNAALKLQKVGKGLVKDAKAQKLAFQHWIEAIDPRHRYGHNLSIYFDEWCRRQTQQPYFYWLDIGDGKTVDLDECPRSRLNQECINYLGPQERECYEYKIVEGKFIHKQTGNALDTKEQTSGSKWIFVMSVCNKLYAGEKRKGMFHHSSFLAGGVTLAAGRLVVECGKLKSVSAYSGHYRPTDENLSIFLAFLQKSGVKLEDVKVTFVTETNRAMMLKTYKTAMIELIHDALLYVQGHDPSRLYITD
ncbi:hypothetical protein SASPL_104659 [Salvia splendens]|uniref:Protein kinase domain-containing protein n=1 Tax=Salvia splendens TaxID=180675 RepID=A0A8X8YJL4_SALSN|nr:hypothetical protein SASPL_104659 [Salvia splendens]